MATTIQKMTESEARELCEENGIDFDHGFRGEIIRRCSYCSAYVSVDDFSGEREIAGKIHYDIDDECAERLERGENVEPFDADDYDPDEEEEGE